MAISRSNVLYLLNKAIPLLEELNIPWWLGRGVLRNFYLTKDIGEKNSDLDFHIWEKDKQILKEKLEPVFSSEGYQVQDPDYKIAFYKPPEKHEFFVEFMLLIEDPSNPEFVYHARRNDKKYAPKVCFSGYETIQIDDIRVKIPVNVEKYFLGTYGPKWKDNNANDKLFQSTPDIFNIGES